MNKLSLNAKIVFVLSIFVVANFAISGLALVKMSDLAEATADVGHKFYGRVKRSKDILDGQRRLVIAERSIVLEKSLENQRKFEPDMAKDNEEIRKLLAESYEAAPPQNKPKWENLQKQFAAWWELHLQTRALVNQGKAEAALELMQGKGVQIRAQIREELGSIVEFNEKAMEDAITGAETVYSQARTLMVLISLSAILIGMVMAYAVMRKVNQAIDRVITGLDDNSNQVTSAAQQIASASEQLSQASTEQASSLEETAASIEEMTSMVQKNADNASKATEISGVSQRSAERGKKVVQDMIAAIQTIQSGNENITAQINESNQQISEIVKVIAEIGNKTKVINDIVFQTKLLSFNASVEAARAGEHGKGFAVVAEEVGNLAQMSGNAAKEISTMLEGSIQKVEGIVNDTKTRVEKLMNDSQQRIATGTQVAQDCGQVLEEIVGNVSQVTQMAGEISTACEEQARGCQEITKAMSQLDQVTQENAATSEEAASSAEELSAQAESLRGVVKVLISTIKGDSHKVADDGLNHAPHQAKRNEPARVMPLKRAASNSPSSRFGKSAVPMKAAVGSENGVPAEHDPRFKEV